MDTSGFFQYPGTDLQVPTDNPPGFLENRGEDDWALVLEHTETRLYRAGRPVLTEGESGRLDAPSGSVAPVSTFGEVAFLDGRPRAVTVTATSDAEVLRLGHEAFLALSARRPDLGRAVLTDIGAILAARFRHASDQIAGWTG
jgi:CRP/FNR family transcriptional regulator, cyclic AMP receptor protein